MSFNVDELEAHNLRPCATKAQAQDPHKHSPLAFSTIYMCYFDLIEPCIVLLQRTEGVSRSGWISR